MKLKLMIADRRPDLLATWAEVFQGVEGVVLINADAPTLASLREVDAELMRSMMAHERYGGKPIPGLSQILSTKGESGTPPWVVTTAPFAAHFERKSNDSTQQVLVQDEKLAPDQEDYIVFRKVFDCIDQFNQSDKEPKIRTLGFELEFLLFPRGNPRKEAEAVFRAYIDQYANAKA